MKTRISRALVLLLFSTSIVALPTASSAQLLDACRATGTLDIDAGTPTAHGTASYSCANPKIEIAVTGFLLLNGVPVDTDAVLEQNSSEASVDLSFSCVPGVWSVVAIGTGADRALPAVGVGGPMVFTNCDPSSP